MATFVKGAPRWTPPQALPAPIWAIHHHQGCRGQFLRAQYSPIPWSAPSVQCGPPSALLPPLLDTLDMAEQLTPTELNPDCMEQAITDRIMDTQIKNTHQQKIQLYRVVKASQLLHQGKWLTSDQVQQRFPHLMEELNAMGTIVS